MNRIELTERQRWTIINGLTAAANQYTKDAADSRLSRNPNLVDAFLAQATEANSLACLVEQADQIVLAQQ